jgi:hypothetical protein
LIVITVKWGILLAHHIGKYLSVLVSVSKSTQGSNVIGKYDTDSDPENH